jgi:DNA-binding CsgD family transcriptional regulator
MIDRELKRFSEAVLALHECKRPADLGASILRAIQYLLDADSHVLNWIGVSRFEDISMRSGEVPRETSLEVFNSHITEHPLIDMIHDARKLECSRALRWSDRMSFREFQHTGLYHDFFRHMATRHQFAITMKVGDDAALGLSFNRTSRDFRDEELRLTEMFAPHIRQLIGQMRGRLEMDQALALRELALHDLPTVVVDEQARPLFIADQARRWLHDYFPIATASGLPEKLALWLRGNPSAGAVFIQIADGRKLTCTCGEITTRQESDQAFMFPSAHHSTHVRCLRFREERTGKDVGLLQKLGLTPREADVLFWMAEGKRNSEIGIILGTSVRTVDKHRENLFAKLGVDNRTMAVAMAWDAMRPGFAI